MKKNLLTMLTFILCLSACQAQIEVYDWPETAPKSSLYDIKIYQDGNEFSPYAHFSEPNLKEGQDGHGVTGILQDRTMTYTIFGFEGEIIVEVTKLYGKKAPRVEISPKAYAINPFFFDGKTVKFKLKQEEHFPQYISVNFKSDDNKDDDGNNGLNIKNGVMIFADHIESGVPTEGNVVTYSPTANLEEADVIYFPPGDYNLKEREEDGQIDYHKNGQEIYAAGGAFIRGAVNARGHDNLKLRGRGIFTGIDMVWHEIRDENGRKEAFMNFLGSEGSLFEGISIVNPTHHTIPSYKRTTIKNLKIIGWASNHDGVRPGLNSHVEGIFVKTSDDYDYARSLHIVSNSIFWPMRNGSVGQLGWNNLGDGHATYKDCFYINAEWIGSPSKRNVGVIGSVLNQAVHQEKDSLINLECEKYLGILLHLTLNIDENKEINTNDLGEIKDFVFKNIKLETPFLTPNGNLFKQPVKGLTRGGGKAMIKDFQFINVVAGGELVTQSNYSKYFNLDPNTTSGFKFLLEGALLAIDVQHNEGGEVFPPASVIDAPQATNQTISIMPEPGYRIKKVIIDGKELPRIQTFRFLNIHENHQVEVVFEQGDDYFDLTSEPFISVLTDETKSINVVPEAPLSTEDDLLNDLLWFPNPVKGILQINMSANKPYDISVINLTGQKLLRFEGTGNQEFDISTLAKGTYILKAIIDDQVMSKKFILK